MHINDINNIIVQKDIEDKKKQKKMFGCVVFAEIIINNVGDK